MPRKTWRKSNIYDISNSHIEFKNFDTFGNQKIKIRIINTQILYFNPLEWKLILGISIINPGKASKSFNPSTLRT